MVLGLEGQCNINALYFLQCFDANGWVTGNASGIIKKPVPHIPIPKVSHPEQVDDQNRRGNG